MTGPATRTPHLCFAAIFLADFLVRTAYLTAKYPALTLFADSLGASELLLGTIVSVSVLTGVFTKPLIGFLSDRVGHGAWLIGGTALFALTPPLYLLVPDTDALVALRLVHGLATAIYGPITLVFIAGLDDTPRAEWFGCFGLARQVAAIVAPVIGGVLLSFWAPDLVIAATSLVACCAFVPVIYAVNSVRSAKPAQKAGLSLRDAVGAILQSQQIAIFGVMELTSRIGVYAVKVFLPLAIIQNGGTPLEAGGFLAVQEATAAVLRPIAGRIADRHGVALYVAAAGLSILGMSLFMLPATLELYGAWVVAASIGVGQGLYEPVALALIARSVGTESHGLAFGTVGSLRNLGKILGPVAGGAGILATSFDTVFMLLGIVPASAVVLLLLVEPRPRNERGGQT
ncbi:MAG: MFS transporter [Pseudomonadota bacterium]